MRALNLFSLINEYRHNVELWELHLLLRLVANVTKYVQETHGYTTIMAEKPKKSYHCRKSNAM